MNPLIKSLTRLTQKSLPRKTLPSLPYSAVAILAGIMIANPVFAEQKWKLRVHHFLSASSVTHKLLLVPWARSLEKDSSGRLEVVIYPSMQLGGAPPQLYDQAVRGLADVVWTLPGYTAGRFPKMEVFELPFMASSAEATSQAAYDFYRRQARDEFKDTHVLTVHAHRPGPNAYEK